MLVQDGLPDLLINSCGLGSDLLFCCSKWPGQASITGMIRTLLAFYLAFAKPDWAQPVQNGSKKLLLSVLDLLARNWHILHVMTLEAEDLLAHVNNGVFKLM